MSMKLISSTVPSSQTGRGGRTSKLFMSVAYPFVAIPHHIVRGGHGAINIAVLSVILSHGKCFASVKTIAKEAGCSEKPTRKAIKYWRDNAKRLNIDFEFTEGGGKHLTNTIEVSFPFMYDPDTLANLPGGGSKSARGVLAKVPPQGDHLRRIIKKQKLLSQDEQALGFILT